MKCRNIKEKTVLERERDRGRGKRERAETTLNRNGKTNRKCKNTKQN